MKGHSLLTELEADLYRTGDRISNRYQKDWSGVVGPLPEVLFLPRTADDVARILHLCNTHRQPLVTQGGLTGLSGGAVPQSGEWVLSLERMTTIHEIDVEASTISVQAGVTLHEIHEHAEQNGLQFPIDMGSRGSCTAGGLVATNAGGTQVIRYGMVRSLILGLSAVLANGTQLTNDNKLLKNNAGYDLKHLFIGTEGTLGVVTDVTFRLFPARSKVHSALCGVADFASVASFLHLAQRHMTGIARFEVLWEHYFTTSAALTHQRNPFAVSHPFYVLLEAESNGSEAAESLFESMLTRALEHGAIRDAVLARNSQERSGFWKIRDGVTELFSRYEPLANFDIGIPLSRMEEFAINVEEALAAEFQECHVFLFGHIGDGNLHLIASTRRQQDVHEIERIVFDLTRQAGGTITAEHGIGVTKKEWLSYCRSPEEVATMKQLKHMFDPAQILNPGRIFDV